MNSSSRRTLMACNFCRQRKRKCNGQLPQCRTCRSKNLRCIYSRPDLLRDETLLHRSQSPHLEVADSFLHQRSSTKDFQHRVGRSSTCSSSEAQVPSSAPNASPYVMVSSAELEPGTPARTRQHDFSVAVDSLEDENTPPPITIPLRHQTSTSHLLMLPQMNFLTGLYPDEFFFKLENETQRLIVANGADQLNNSSPSLGPGVDAHTTNLYLENFFELVHPFHPFLDRDITAYQYELTVNQGFDSGSKSALVLAIMAVGAIVSHPVSPGEGGTTSIGDKLMKQTLKVLLPLWANYFAHDILIPQALLLCAIYFTYTVDPLMAWRLAHMSSTSIQQDLNNIEEAYPQNAKSLALIRLSWVCFVIECDILAEFHLPRSGIELLVDKMPFPDYEGPPCSRNLYVLADIGARSLLNRIHHALFSENMNCFDRYNAVGSTGPNLSHSTDPSLLRICLELDRQLGSWYDSLPAPIKPDLDGKDKGNKQACLLRLRYWSAKQNIYRPFVIYATSFGVDNVSGVELDKCGICLDACRAFIMTASHILSDRTPYTYSVAQCSIGSSLILSVAARNATLKKAFVADVESVLDRTVEDLKPWTHSSRSIHAAYGIISLVAMKIRLERQDKSEEVL